MARQLAAWCAPDAAALVAAVVLDLLIGDPQYRWHPIRLIGATLSVFERFLRAAGFDGRGGGVLLFFKLAAVWGGALLLVGWIGTRLGTWTAWMMHALLVYSLLALGDLLRHVRRVDRAAGQHDLPGAQAAIAHLVGRDTERMDAAACRRASLESLGENLTDGFTSPLCYYAVAGLPGLLLFKIVSTMDSMVGFKSSRYLRFGWCGARLDDLMNYIPARLTWLLIVATAIVVPGASAPKAFLVGLRQHSVLPGPNSGWSEAAIAGAIQRRLVGPIWQQGTLVTELWIGDPADPPASTHDDVTRAIVVSIVAGMIAVGMAVVWLASW